MPQRPAASVIVPFAGSPSELSELRVRLETLQLDPGDEVLIADNRPGAQPAEIGRVRLHPAGAVAAPGFARNRGGAAASGDWLVFIDADTDPVPDLLDAYFTPPPGPDTAILAGSIVDVADPPASLSARHAVARAQMSQTRTLDRADHPYAQSANLAIRRDAFIRVGGFAEHARAGEDADLCFRVAEAGFRIEPRPDARVDHRTRRTLAGVLLQLAVHGSGAAWCEQRHPGSFPPTPPGRFLRRLIRSGLDAMTAIGRGDHQTAAFALLEIPEAVAFALGRQISNQPRWRMRR